VDDSPIYRLGLKECLSSITILSPALKEGVTNAYKISKISYKNSQYKLTGLTRKFFTTQVSDDGKTC
jgi:hypothetical protein